jgi:NADH-quinone oxidoreductase subunit H
MLGGWSSNNKYGLLGALRTCAQMISYELAMGITLISVIMVSGSLSLRTIVEHQAANGWNLWHQPVAFILFLICGLAELNRTPFDMPEAESELACGFNIEYSSMKFAMFFMAEYAHMISMAAIATCFFLGGWQPIPGLGFIPGIVWFLLKVFVLVFFFIWERGTFPRLRYDQVMHLGWKFLMPVALLNLLGTGLYYTLMA